MISRRAPTLTTMRKLIVTNIVSLDGCSAGPGDDVMALPMDPAFDGYSLDRLRTGGTVLLGRRTYDGFREFWPGVADDPAAAAAGLGIPPEALDDPVNREISRRLGAIAKVVVSDTLTPERTEPWRETTTILRRGEAHARIAALKREPGGEILTFGSGTLWNDLFAAGLVDELHLIVAPVVLGAGTPAFAAPPPAPLRLLGAQTFDGSHNVLVRYATG